MCRNRKRIAAFVLSLLLTAGIVFAPGTALNVSAAALSSVTLTGDSSNNESMNTYVRWSHTVKSYITEQADKTLIRAENISGGNITVEWFKADGSRTKKVNIQAELPVFGGFYFGRNYYFAVFGKRNENENPQQEVVRVVRYDKNMNRIDSVSYYGINTRLPFDAGSMRFAEIGNTLYVYTCHEMFMTSDGNNHQTNMTLILQQSPLKEISTYSAVASISSTGYVSHSFNQFIATDGTTIYRADHGDSHMRGVSITAFRAEDGIKNITYTVPLKFAGPNGANSTGATLGGMALTENRILLAGSIDSQKANYDDYYDARHDDQKNVYVISAAKSLAEEENKVVYLTSYNDNTNLRVSTPHIVALGGNAALVLWEETQVTGKTVVKAVVIGEDGKTKTSVNTLEASLSDCAPVVTRDGSVIWYVTKGRQPVLYRIKPAGLGNIGTVSHLWVKGSVLQEATCDKEGTSEFFCAVCGETKRDKTAPTGHDWGDWKYEDYNVHTRVCRTDPSHTESQAHEWEPVNVSRNATCTQDGYGTIRCGICRMKFTGPIPATGHDWNSKPVYKNENVHVYVCKNNSTHTTEESHTWGELQVTVQPTDTSDGKGVRTCSVCGGTKTEIIQSEKHNWILSKVIKAATCEADGEAEYYCPDCKKTKREKLSATDHDWSAKPVKKNDSVHVYTCKNDSSHKKEEAHRWGELKITKEATETAEGEGVRTCSVCGGTKTEKIPVIKHEWKQRSVIKATCETDGVIEYYCNDCGKTKQEKIPATGHSWSSKPVYKDGSVHVYVCKNDEKHTKEEAHKWGELVITVQPTATSAGEGKRTCSVCGGTKTEKLADQNHNWVQKSVIKAATCETDGEAEFYCTVCGETKRDKIPATGHDWGPWEYVDYHTHKRVCKKDSSHTESQPHPWKEVQIARAATCTQDGYGVVLCEECLIRYTGPLLATGHDWGDKAVKKDDSVHVYTCKNDATHKQEEAHKWGDLQVTVQATATSAGKGKRVCSVCGAEKTEVIPAGNGTSQGTDKQPETEQTLDVSKPRNAGDVDANGVIEASDARIALRAAVNLENVPSGTYAYYSADVDLNGKIEAGDARSILRAAVGLEDPKTWRNSALNQITSQYNQFSFSF